MSINLQTQAQDNIIFSQTKIKLELDGNLVESNQFKVMLENGPVLNNDYSYLIKFSGDPNVIVEYDFIVNSSSGPLEFNLFQYSRIREIILRNPMGNTTLGIREIPSAIWNHVSHVYLNWTFGTNPPPDGRGFGQGAISDSLVLDSLFTDPISSESALHELSENVLNLFFGNSFDLNEDASTTTLSDNFGLFNYTIGMRDHIRNTGLADSNQTSDLSLASEKIVEQFLTIMDEGEASDIYSNLNSSDTLMGDIYRSIMNIDENITSSNFNQLFIDLKNQISDLTEFLKFNYDSFRQEIFDYTFLIEDTQLIISSETSKSEDSPIQFSIIIATALLLPLIVNKFVSEKKKL